MRTGTEKSPARIHQEVTAAGIDCNAGMVRHRFRPVQFRRNAQQRRQIDA